MFRFAGRWEWTAAAEIAMVPAANDRTTAADSGSEAERGSTRGPSTGETIGGIRMRPALLACSAVMCCCAVLAWQPAQASAGRGRLDRTERRVIRIINRIRARHGLRRLHASRSLSRAANQHSGDMLRRNYIGHASSDGTSMGSRVRRYTGARWIGEAIAVVSGHATARRTVRMWMHSPPHRAVLLSGSAHRIGLGKRRGMLYGARRSVFTADFASGG
jgi:uncharacterized protein YkwD